MPPAFESAGDAVALVEGDDFGLVGGGFLGVKRPKAMMVRRSPRSPRRAVRR